MSHGGEPVCDYASAASDPSELHQSCGSKNHALLDSLTEGKHSEWILSHIGEESKLGRISKPVLASEVDWEHALAARRFVVEQGVKQL